MNSLASCEDKKLLLQEAANKIKNLTKSEEHPIQEGDVSSSNTSILATELFGNILLETLNGFLFVVSNQGRVVSVTDNIGQHLGYSPSDWADQSIYNFLRVADHALFSKALLPLDAGAKYLADVQSCESQVLKCHFKHSLKDVDKKVDSLVPMQVFCLPQHMPSDILSCSASIVGMQMYLVCIAQRMPDGPRVSTNQSNKPSHRQLPPDSHWHNTSLASLEGYTTKIDLQGNILVFQPSGGGCRIHAFEGRNMQDFVHSNDIHLFQKHLEEVKKAIGDATSSIYRFRLRELHYVFFRSQSHLVNSDFIVSSHSVIRECDSSELKGSASASLMKSLIQSGSTPLTASQPVAASQYMSNSLYGYNSQTSPSPNRAGMKLMGNPPLSDVNYNEVYPSVGHSWEAYDSINWRPSSPANTANAVQRQRHGSAFSDQSSPLQYPVAMPHNSFVNQREPKVQGNPQQQALRENSVLGVPSNAGKLRDLLVNTEPMGSDSKGTAITSSSFSNAPSMTEGDVVLKKLLQSDDDDDGVIVPVSSSVIPSSAVQSIEAGEDSPNKTPSEHQLLKKLLNEDVAVDDPEKPARSGLLKKLLKEDPDSKELNKNVTSPASSPTTPTNQPLRRTHSSNTLIINASHREDLNKHLSQLWDKQTQQEENGRAPKRKLTPISTSEADSSSATTGSAPQILTQLLTKPTSLTFKADPCQVSATPFDKHKTSSNSLHEDIVDVVDDRIMYGQEHINMEKFSQISSGKLLRQNSKTKRDLDAMDAQTSFTSPHTIDTGFNSYSYQPKGASELPSPMTYHSNLSNREPMCSNNFLQNLVTDTDPNGSILQQLFNSSDDSFFKEIESLLGDNSHYQSQVTTPEDEMAISLIERHLVNSVENLSNRLSNSSQNSPISPNSSPYGMHNAPAYASNPIQAPTYNISHPPKPSHGPYNQSSSSGSAFGQTNPSMLANQGGMSGHQGLAGSGGRSSRARGSMMQPSVRPTSLPMTSSVPSSVRMRRLSGGSVSMAGFPRPLSPVPATFQGLPKNFAELMKSSQPPPNVEVTADMVAAGFSQNELPHDLISPRAGRSAPSYSQSPMEISTSPQFNFSDHPLAQFGSPHPMLHRQMSQQSTGMQGYAGSGSDYGYQSVNQPPHPAAPSPMRGAGLTSYGPHSGPLPSAQMEGISSMSTVSTSTSQHVRQEIRAKCAARVSQQQYHQEPPTPQKPPSLRQGGQGASPSHTNSFHNLTGHIKTESNITFDSAELPQEILDQITELTSEQMDRHQKQVPRKEHALTSHPNPGKERELVINKISQSHQEAQYVREQLRELSGTHHAQTSAVAPLDTLFRTQLSQQKPKTTGSVINEHAKLQAKPTSISIVSTEPRPEIQDIQPNDNRNSLLQQLLTE